MTEQAPPPVPGLGDAQVGMWLSGLTAFVCFCFLGFETVRCIYQWLKFGDAEFLRLVQFLPAPQVEWVGIQRVINFVWNASLFFESLVVMFLSGWLWGHFNEQVENLKKRFPVSGVAQ
jgi:hypothetical protein